jgi:hypothetical protein
MKRYLPKYPLTSDDSFSSDELQKIADNIGKHEEREWFKKYIPIVIVIALLIVYLLSRLGG